MSRELIYKLANLKMEEKSLKRELEYTFKKKKSREKLFFRLKEVKEEINKTKFLLRLESEKRKHENSSN